MFSPLTVATLAILATVAVPADDEKVVPAFTPAAGATLVYASEDWQVWTVQDQFNFHRQAPQFRSRYYLQEPGKPNATLVFQGRNVSARVITVLPDRTILLDGVTYIDPDGSTAVERPKLDGESVHILRGDPDGVLMQPYRLNRTAPVYFVPIKGHRLDLAAKVQVTDATGVQVNTPPRFLRGPHAFAWLNQVFDLETRVRKRFPVNPQPMAFDGETLVYYDFKPGVSETLRRAFSVADGTELPAYPMGRNEVDFAVKDRVVYTFARPSSPPGEPRRLLMEAVELASKDGRATPLLTLPWGPRGGAAHEVDTPRVITKAGIDVWDGQVWRKVAWLKPAP
jgi:hypothetical protein